MRTVRECRDVVFFAVLFAFACVPHTLAPGDRVGPLDATCAGVCLHRRELGCSSGRSTPGGVSCEVVCENAVEHGLRLDLRCRAAATTCAAMDDCGLLP